MTATMAHIRGLKSYCSRQGMNGRITDPGEISDTNGCRTSTNDKKSFFGSSIKRRHASGSPTAFPSRFNVYPTSA
ncbi:hypothetical protein [Sphingomonas sp. UYP23]